MPAPFLKELKQTEFNNYYGVPERAHRMFERLDCGKYEVSVQASAAHYCTPRETLTDVEAYRCFEVAIWYKNNRDLDWITPHNCGALKHLKDRCGDRFESGGGASIGAYVAVEDVQAIIDALRGNK